MVLTLLTSIVAFIVILSDLNWLWVDPTESVNFSHSFFGIVTIVIAIAQVDTNICFKIFISADFDWFKIEYNWIFATQNTSTKAIYL